MTENTWDASLAVVILAAGQGTRMRSALPKVLHRIGGRPLVGHVLDTARDLSAAHVLVVVRHERDLASAHAAEGHEVGILCDSSTGGAHEERLFAEIRPHLSLGLTRLPIRRSIGPSDARALWSSYTALRSLKPDSHALTPEQVEEIAASLNVRPQDVTEMEVRLYGQDMALEGRGTDDGENDFAPIAYLSDEGQQEPSAILEERRRDELHGSGLLQALESLDERSRRIIEARWLKDEGGATLQELADEFGVSAERIRQIEARAMTKMRGALAEYA